MSVGNSTRKYLKGAEKPGRGEADAGQRMEVALFQKTIHDIVYLIFRSQEVHENFTKYQFG